ncbi:hypothetical protein Tco_1229195 [Tanacetum coccineum]
MHQFWHTITKIKNSSSYKFKLAKKKCTIDVQVFHDILQICPRLLNQEFVVPPSSDLEIVSFIKELGYTGDINSVTKVGMYYNQNVDIVELLWEDFMFQIDNKDSKKKEKMYYPRFTKEIIQHFISKDKSISMRNRLFMHTIQDDSILGSLRFVSKTKEYQVYRALIPAGMTNKKMLISTAYKTYLAFATGATTPKKARKFKKPASPLKKKTLVAVEEPAKKPAARRYEGAGLEPKVPYEQKGKSTNTSEGIGLILGVPNVSKADSFESEYESWEDSNDDSDDDDQQSDDEQNLKDVETANEGKGYEEMTKAEKVDAEIENVNQEVVGDQVNDDAQETVTVALATQKTEVQLQSSFISSDYATKFLNFDNIPSVDSEIISMMDIKENEVKTLRNVNHSSAIHATIKSEVSTIVKEYLGTSLDDTLHKICARSRWNKQVNSKRLNTPSLHLIRLNYKHKALYHALMESILKDKDAIDKDIADRLKKRKPDDADRDEGPPAGPDQGLKRKKMGKDTKPSKKAKSTGTLKGTIKSQPKSTSKSAQAEEIISDLTQDILVGLAYKLLKGTCRSYVELKYNMEECYKALNDQLDWNNHEGGSTGRTYMTSLTKTKDAKYDLQGIEDMVPNLVSKHDVYSTKRILAVTNVKVNIWYGYGHLEEIEVRRSDQQLYKFMEGDFPRLYLNDIKDMLLLVVQNRLFNHKGGDIVHLVTTLQRNRLMCSHELYKFSDNTLISVQDKLKDMLNNLEIGYTSFSPRRRWSNLDKKWYRIMVKDIDHQLLERRLMRSLEKFVGGREYEEDLRLLQRTI